MINSVHFKNYRCFGDFSVNNLSRINLFVGMNNSGKSSILEGICFLQSRNWNFLLQVLMRRGWTRNVFNQTNQLFQYINITNSIINLHAIKKGDKFLSIEAKGTNYSDKIDLRLVNPGLDVNPEMMRNLILYHQLGQFGTSMIGQLGLEAEFSHGENTTYKTPLLNFYFQK